MEADTGKHDGDKAAHFLSGSTALLAASLLSGTLSFAWTVLMSRLLGPEGYGFVGPFLNAFWMLTAALTLGIPHAMATFISDRHHEDPAEAKRVMAQGMWLLFVIAGLFTAAAVAGILTAGAAHRISRLMAALSLVMLAALLGRQFYMGMFAVMAGLQKYTVLAISNSSYSILMLSCSIVFVIAARRYYPGSTDACIIAGAAGIGAAAVIQYILSLFIVKFAGVSASSLFAWKSAGGGARRLLLFGLPSAIAMIAGSNLSYIPPVAVSFFAHKFGVFGATQAQNAVHAGWFSGGFTYALAPMLIVGMVFAIVPAVSEAESQGNHALMQRYFDLAVKYCVTIMLYVMSVYVVFAGRIVELFSGGKFPEATMGPLTTTLAAGMCICMMIMLMSNILIGTKRPVAPAVATTVILVAEVAALAAAGVGRSSIFIAAAAFDATVLIGFAFLAVYLKVKVGLSWSWSALPRPLAAGAATALLTKLIPLHGNLFMIAAAASLPCYFAILYLIGGIKKEELKMFRGGKTQS